MTNYYNNLNLKNKLAYVIGGFGLLGKETSYALASCGAKVIILDVKIDQNFLNKINKNNLEVKYCSFNLKNILNLEKKYSSILSKYNTPSIFVNCSYPKTADWHKNNFKNIKFSSFKKNIEFQLISNAWITFMTAQSMKNKKIEGSIIQVGSVYGTLAQDISLYKKTKINENITYSAIKGGLNIFGQQLAAYYGQNNIRVNTIAPGGILVKQDKVFLKNYSNKTPLKRMGYAHEVASTILFLSSDSSSYITGETIMVDGGYSKI